MMTIFIIAIIIFIIYIASGKDDNYRQKNTSSNYINKYKSDEVIRNELKQKRTINTKVSATTSSSFIKDNSIIDITGQSTNINTNYRLEHYIPGIPEWKSQYSYHFSEINQASTTQKEFYEIFKYSYINGIYYNLYGNTNYAFNLINDFDKKYESDKSFLELENQIKKIIQIYPEIKLYGSMIISRKKDANNISTPKNTNVYYNGNFYDEAWQLGNKYKDKLKLNEEEVKLLNSVYNPSNSFFNIEFCGLEILKLYIAVISEMKNKYTKEKTTIDQQFLAVADIIARKQFRYKIGSENYKYCIETAPNAFYSHIFKCCENAVRELYDHKRKLNTDNYYTNTEAKKEFETKILLQATELLPILISKVSQIDEATDIELYAQNTNRWKIKYEELITNYNENSNKFIDAIYSLATLNEKNPSIENIFFEASKFISKYDKESALTFYVSYLYCDLESSNFNNKQLPKNIKKILFQSNEQLFTFEEISRGLIEDKDVDKALKAISNIYKVKRKKIELNRASIKEVLEQHSETVELLNEYLKDDLEDENNIIKSKEISNDEIQIEIIQKSVAIHQSTFINELTFTKIHTTTLELFAKSNFSVPQIDLEMFAKSKGVFKNQLIESINDTCYEFLDDVLIEEEDDCYTINTNYFQRILTK